MKKMISAFLTVTAIIIAGLVIGCSGALNDTSSSYLGTDAGGKNNPTDIAISWPTGITALYYLEYETAKTTESVLRTLADISLAEYTNGDKGAFAWKTPDDVLGGLGKRSHNVIYTPANTASGAVQGNVEITVRLAEVEWVNAGSFTLGRNGDGTTGNITNAHQVTLTQGFYAGKYLVTQEQYQLVIGSNPSYFHGGSGREPVAGEIQDKRPVEAVSWYNALVFCNKLSLLEGLTPAYSISGSTNPDEWISANGGSVPTSSNSAWNSVIVVPGSEGYRLPTEAQWEYAAKGGEAFIYSGSDTLGDVAWSSGSRTRQVGLKDSNAFGLYDMSGNLYEWCWDLNAAYTAAGKTDPTGAGSGTARIIRGGSYDEGTTTMRCVYRASQNPNTRGQYFGFRIIRP